ncbi:twin-arginine translocase TatA/TatE family subunit [Silvanigrella aquatica]|uniref:Sec-independent protein translocase protein TatB n=1 Tax=Silvanigrella aquatica TaxID=1915309 RepID=A0A1L4CX36_9BACT|nr:twin-arginine translocase TatA/TatE family subunit [Silvanigrella aquatica]APJ02507.1 hypothetical protein AXG55_00585 [Silvanigrella aquatica]
MFGFSGGEILLIALIALILFGNDKLPDNMKKMIKGLNQAKKMAKEVQVSWQDVKTDVQRSINFEEEKEEMRALMESATIDINEESFAKEHYPIPANFAVPQEEIDAFQEEINANNPENANHFNVNKLENSEELNIAYLSVNDFMMSSEFVGPRP